MTTEKVTIESEMKRRMNFINDPAFRIMVRDKFVELGIGADDWNKNAAFYWMLIANEFCALEDQESQ